MEKKDLRIIFMGTPEFAVSTLKALVENDYNVVAVVTQPDKPVGRHGSVLHPSEVKQYALSNGLPVLQPEKMKNEAFLDELKSFNANLQVVVAFRMLPEVVWSMPEYGTFNVHAALLPQYRGAAPINWAIINGETKTGVTTFFLDHNIDTGRIILQRTFDIPDDADVEYVYDGLMQLGADVCIETIKKIIDGDGIVESLPQEKIINNDETLHDAPKIFKETCVIDWHKSAKEVHDFVRGLSPFPGAWTNLMSPDGTKTVLKIFKTAKTNIGSTEPIGSITEQKSRMYVSCRDNLIEILELQLSGKKRMTAKDFVNGFRDIDIYKVV
jgi:methionyl-tRNA formyltransferase